MLIPVRWHRLAFAFFNLLSATIKSASPVMSYAWLQHLLIDVIPTPVDCVTTIGLSLHLLTIERADLLTQLRQTMAQQGTHRRALHPQNLGDLLKAALLIIAPDHHLTLTQRQMLH